MLQAPLEVCVENSSDDFRGLRALQTPWAPAGRCRPLRITLRTVLIFFRFDEFGRMDLILAPSVRLISFHEFRNSSKLIGTSALIPFRPVFPLWPRGHFGIPLGSFVLYFGVLRYNSLLNFPFNFCSLSKIGAGSIST